MAARAGAGGRVAGARSDAADAAAGRRRWSRCRCCSRPGAEALYDHTIAVIADEERARARGRLHAVMQRVASRAGRQLSQDGEGAKSGLRGPQRRLARRVEGRVVFRPCDTRYEQMSSAAARSRARTSPAPHARGARSRAGAGRARSCSRSARARRDRARDRPRLGRRRGARDHAAAAPRGHHPPAGRGQGPRPGADRRRDLRGVALPRPDLARRRARADADHARHGGLHRAPVRRVPLRPGATSRRRRSTSRTARTSCAGCSTATTATRRRRSPRTTPGTATSTSGSTRTAATLDADDIPFPETRAYVDNVLERRGQYRERYAKELGL